MTEEKENYQKGYFRCKEYFAVDELTGELIPLYIPDDVIAKGCSPGDYAGNPHLDEINKQLRDEGIIEKMKSLYKINKIIDKNKNNNQDSE